MSEIFDRLRDIAGTKDTYVPDVLPLGEVRLKYTETGTAVIVMGIGQELDFGESYGCDITFIKAHNLEDIYANAPEIVLARFNIDPGIPVAESQMLQLVEYVLERVEIAKSFLTARYDVLNRHVSQRTLK